MLERIITLSLRHRFLVVVLGLAFAGGGAAALRVLPIDAFPDTTPVQVQVNTVAPALGPIEVERQITIPVESAIAGLTRLENVRSISKFGFSQVSVVFEDGTDVYFARQLVAERLSTVELPEGIERPEMGPVATGLGEIYHYLVTGKGKSLRDLTTIHDWVVKPRLLSVPGVAEVNTWGGEEKEYHVLVDPSSLVAHDLTMDDVLSALVENNLSVGGGNVTRAGELHVVQGTSLPSNVRQLGEIVVAEEGGVPVRVKNVARVEEGHEIRRGAVTANGKGEVVLGLGFMLMGENSHVVAGRLRERVKEIEDTLPQGVKIRPVYDRTHLVDEVLETVKENLFEGAILVVAVLFLFLGNLRAGLIVASAIPLSMLFAASAMLRLGIAGSLMSLGAIDFGLVVDSSVIQIENSVRHIAQGAGRRSVLETVRDAVLEVRRPTMFGELIIMVVYLPILTLEGVEGKLFRPMALTVIFALTGSLVLSLTLIPALASLLLPRKISHREGFLMRGLKFLYRPVVRFALWARWPVMAGALALLVWGAWLASRLGSEFIPRLSEGSIVINTVRLAGVSLEESVRYGTRMELLLREKFPDEIEDVWVRTGTAEVATDPMGIELSDVFITLTPRSEWTRAKTQEELVAEMNGELEGLPGMRTIFTQPIEMRVNEMIAGIRGDLGVKIYGDDLEILKLKAAEVQKVLESVDGAANVFAEQITGQPVLEITVDPEKTARYGVTAKHVLEIVQGIGGLPAGEVREGQRRFDLVVRLDPRYREDPEAVGRVLVPTATGERIPLSRLATIRYAEGPSTITREWAKRRIVVQANVRGRDTASFVEEARERIESEVVLPPGYSFDFGGQFEHLERARKRLALVVPLALFFILVLLYFSTGSVRDSLIVFTGAPFAALGGVVALHLRGMPFTISAGVGFVAVSGVSMLAGLVMVSTIQGLVAKGLPLRQAIEETRLVRLRPILMTALVAALGFVPMATNTGVGAEVQRPLATVVIGGVISDNLLTLLVLPALYATFGAAGRGRPAETAQEGDAPALSS
ncbi:MAG: efflux RND transporter permease subunit [Planctomycetes bacterium]|nr:efflux RND transporter permease subunit [Planctomycetota bacterium]